MPAPDRSRSEEEHHPPQAPRPGFHTRVELLRIQRAILGIAGARHRVGHESRAASRARWLTSGAWDRPRDSPTRPRPRAMPPMSRRAWRRAPKSSRWASYALKRSIRGEAARDAWRPRDGPAQPRRSHPQGCWRDQGTLHAANARHGRRQRVRPERSRRSAETSTETSIHDSLPQRSQSASRSCRGATSLFSVLAEHDLRIRQET